MVGVSRVLIDIKIGGGVDSSPTNRLMAANKAEKNTNRPFLLKRDTREAASTAVEECLIANPRSLSRMGGIRRLPISHDVKNWESIV